jgi:hypothetical protein
MAIANPLSAPDLFCVQRVITTNELVTISTTTPWMQVAPALLAAADPEAWHALEVTWDMGHGPEDHYLGVKIHLDVGGRTVPVDSIITEAQLRSLRTAANVLVQLNDLQTILQAWDPVENVPYDLLDTPDDLADLDGDDLLGGDR